MRACLFSRQSVPPFRRISSPNRISFLSSFSFLPSFFPRDICMTVAPSPPRIQIGIYISFHAGGRGRATYLLKLGRVINVKSPGNHWHAHAHYSPYFQIKPVIDQSYNIQPLFFNIKEFSIRIRFPPEFESIRSPVWWNENWLRTTQTAAGTESYSITLKPKSKGWML